MARSLAKQALSIWYFPLIYMTCWAPVVIGVLQTMVYSIQVFLNHIQIENIIYICEKVAGVK